MNGAARASDHKERWIEGRMNVNKYVERDGDEEK